MPRRGYYGMLKDLSSAVVGGTGFLVSTAIDALERNKLTEEHGKRFSSSASGLKDTPFTLDAILSLYTGAHALHDPTRTETHNEVKALAIHMAGLNVDLGEPLDQGGIRKNLLTQYPALKQIKVAELPVGNIQNLSKWMERQKQKLIDAMPLLQDQLNTRAPESLFLHIDRNGAKVPVGLAISRQWKRAFPIICTRVKASINPDITGRNLRNKIRRKASPDYRAG